MKRLSIAGCGGWVQEPHSPQSKIPAGRWGFFQKAFRLRPYIAVSFKMALIDRNRQNPTHRSYILIFRK